MSAETSRRPLISFTILGRDDDYMPDFKYRLTTTLNFMAEQAKKTGRLGDVELVVTDWASQVPLAEALQLGEAAAAVTRFIYVPAGVAVRISGSAREIHRAVAMNVGIRRAEGRFIMNYAADTLMPAHALRAVFDVVEGRIAADVPVDRTYFSCLRHRVPWEFVDRQPSVEGWERYLTTHAAWLQLESAALLSLSKGVGAYMMDRHLWSELRGFDERLASWGWHEVELASRATQINDWCELSAFGASLYHMEHPPNGGRSHVIAAENPRSFPAARQVNDEGWGLATIDLPISTATPVKTRTDRKPPVQTRRRSETAASSHMRRIVQLGAEYSWPASQSELAALVLLCGVLHSRYVARYLDIGATAAYGMAAVADHQCFGEMFGVDCWQGTLERNSPLRIEAALRRRQGFQGYLRFMNGDLLSSVDRLKASWMNGDGFDLACVRVDLLGDHAAEIAAGVLVLLQPDGCLIASSEHADRLEKLSAELVNEHRGFERMVAPGGQASIIHQRGDTSFAALTDDWQRTMTTIRRARTGARIRRGLRAMRRSKSYGRLALRSWRLLRDNVNSRMRTS